MNPASDLIQRYERIAHVSRQMLQAAECSDWAQFEQLERDCQLAIDELRAATNRAVLHEEVQPVRQRVLRQVLADDANIRHLMQPALKQALGWITGPPRTAHDSG